MKGFHETADALRKYGLVVALVLVVLYFGLTTDERSFLKAATLLNVTDQISVNLVLAVGMTFVIVSGGIDLSVGSVVAFAGTVAASVVVHGLAVSLFGAGLTLIPLLSPLVMVILGCLAGIITGIACGCFNGFVITRFRVAPFIATLAVMLVARGLANLYVHGGRVDGVPREFVVIGAGRLPAAAIGGYTVLPPIPVAAIIAFALAGVAHVVLTRTTFGRRVYAIGGSEDVAQLSGIPLGRTKLAIYGLCGGLAGLGGILEASRTWCGDPTAGAYFELDAIAATVVGGASLMGGAGSLGGTVLGALLIGTLNSGLVHKGVSEFYQLVVKGAVILGAVVLDQLTKRRA